MKMKVYNGYGFKYYCSDQPYTEFINTTKFINNTVAIIPNLDSLGKGKLILVLKSEMNQFSLYKKEISNLLIKDNDMPEIEKSFLIMSDGWIKYAKSYYLNNNSFISKNKFLGSRWEYMGNCLLDFLNGDIGNLDSSFFDKMISNEFVNNGFCNY